MVIITATDIGVRQWQGDLRFGFSGVDRYFVHAVAQDRGDVFVVHAANVYRAMTGGFQALFAILFAEVKQAQTGTIAMLGVTATRQLILNDGLGMRADTRGPT